MKYPFEIALLYPPEEKAKLSNPNTMTVFPKNITAELVKVAIGNKQDGQANLFFCGFPCKDRLPIERGSYSFVASYTWSKRNWFSTSSENINN